MRRITTHPGEVLLEEFMKPLGLSANKLGKAIAVPHNRISEIVRGERGITADTAMRLSRAFGTTPEFWMNLQTAYDLSEVAAERAAAIERQVQPISSGAE